MLRHCGVSLVLYAGLLALTWFGFHKVPTGFIPSQDKGNIYAYLQLPDGASLQRTVATSQKVVQLLTNTPGIVAVSEFAGLSLVALGNSANASSMFIRLAPFDERVKQGLTGRSHHAQPAKASRRGKHPGGLRGLRRHAARGRPGHLGGFKLQVEDRANAGFATLQAATSQLIGAALPKPTKSSRRFPPSAPTCRRSTSTSTAPKPNP